MNKYLLWLIAGLFIVGSIGGYIRYKIIHPTTYATVGYHHEQNKLAAIHIVFPYIRSTEHTPGLGDLTFTLLEHGFENTTRLEIARQAEELGAQYSLSCNNDHGFISLICPAENLPQAIHFINQLIAKAAIPVEEFSRVKKEQIAAIAELQTNPFTAGLDANRRLQYKDHYYAQPAYGTAASIESITREDCLAFLNQIRHPKKVYIVANGGFARWSTQKEIKKLVLALTPTISIHETTVPEKPTGVLTLNLPVKTDTGLILANIIAPAIGKKYALYRCLEAYIGKGLSSPLFIRARDMYGIGYKVGALYDARAYDGLLTLYVQTNQKNKTQCAQEIFDLPALTKFDAVQATRAREYLLTTDRKADEYTLSRGYKLAWNMLYGLPAHYSLAKAVSNISDSELKSALLRLKIQNTVIVE